MGTLNPKVKGQTIAHLAVWTAATLGMAWLQGGKAAMLTAGTGLVATLMGFGTGYQISSPEPAASTIALPSGGSITEVPPG
jgi:hypothetical protein